MRGCKAIADKLPGSSVTMLILWDCNISDKGCKAIATSSGLVGHHRSTCRNTDPR